MKKIIAWFMSFVGGASIGVSISVYGAAEQKAIEIDQNRCLLHAADNGDVEAVKAALRMKADIEIVNNKGHTALMMAVAREHEQVVAALIQEKANVNGESSTKKTPLWLAINSDNASVVEMLVDAGADMNYGWEYRECDRKLLCKDALLQAIERSDLGMIHISLSGKPDIVRVTRDGKLDIVNLLLDKKKKIYEKEDWFAAEREKYVMQHFMAIVTRKFGQLVTRAMEEKRRLAGAPEMASQNEYKVCPFCTYDNEQAAQECAFCGINAQHMNLFKYLWAQFPEK